MKYRAGDKKTKRNSIGSVIQVRKEVKAIPIPNNRYRLLKIAFPAFNMILPFNEISKFGESSKP
jgi:hypothetical protein